VKRKFHLGSRDLADELSGLEKRWWVFEEKAQLGHSAGEVGAAAENPSKELKDDTSGSVRRSEHMVHAKYAELADEYPLGGAIRVSAPTPGRCQIADR
jgi:hypothetical protein